VGPREGEKGGGGKGKEGGRWDCDPSTRDGKRREWREGWGWEGREGEGKEREG